VGSADVADQVEVLAVPEDFPGAAGRVVVEALAVGAADAADR
jgi:hypothetical protein